MWNKLGSDTEITNSEIGPSGQKNGGAFVPGPFPNFGQAFLNSDPNVFTLTFPTDLVVSRSKGTIELWGKFNNLPNSLFDGVTLLSSSPHDLPVFGAGIGFGTNNGCGGGGLYGQFGVATNGVCGGTVQIATQAFYEDSQTFDSLLGDRAAWHHYAIVWDENGISQLGGNKLYLYLDGNLVSTPYYQDGSPWGSIPSDSRFALAYFFNFSGISVAVDNLIVWDDVKTDFSDRFNENPIGYAFSTFTPRAAVKMGPKSNDDSFTVLAKFGLGAGNNGINPVAEDVTVKFGSFSTTIPAGKFHQQGSGLFIYKGTINKVGLKVEIRAPQGGSSITAQWNKPADYGFNLEAKYANLDATVLPPEVKLTIGDDTGSAKLNVGKAWFGQGKDGEHWLSGDDN